MKRIVHVANEPKAIRTNRAIRTSKAIRTVPKVRVAAIPKPRRVRPTSKSVRKIRARRRADVPVPKLVSSGYVRNAKPQVAPTSQGLTAAASSGLTMESLVQRILTGKLKP